MYKIGFVIGIDMTQKTIIFSKDILIIMTSFITKQCIDADDLTTTRTYKLK